ncbi:MAG: FAD-binding oxidoreductase [Planctomyces sp.]
MTDHQLHARLKKLVRRGRVLTAPAQLAGYDTDAIGYRSFRPQAVVLPADAAELTELMRAAPQLRVPVTIRGAGTSLSGGPVAAEGGVLVHTSALRAIRRIDPANFCCEVESGVVLNQLDAALAPHGLFYPPDPSSGPVCTLGGNVAMNAGGAHCFRYGVTSNYVLGVEAVFLNGEVQQFGGPAGGRGAWRDDWKRLLVGSEGTLAAFTRFWLRVVPRPRKCWTYRATFRDLKTAERAVQALALHSSFPVAIELMDPRYVAMVENSPLAVGLPQDCFLIVTEIDGPPELVDQRAEAVAAVLRESGAAAVEFSDDAVTRQSLWKARKVAGGLMGQLSPDFLVQDAVIPRRALAEILQLVYDEADAAGLPVINVFHAGDGNLHPNFLFDSRRPEQVEQVEAISGRLMQRVVAVGGTLSGEHGIGNDKTAYMPLIFGERALRLQLTVPKIFNPGHQLNPLKVFRSRSFVAVQGQGALSHAHGDEKEKFLTRDDALFAPYFDDVDGTACVPATADAALLQQLAAPSGFRFPLLLSDHHSLSQQLLASGFAPTSSRFGALCDNICGMNWRLPGGRVVRIGERVVKSTTGYDLFRFLLHAESDFGVPVDFVVRLRPDSGESRVVRLQGPPKSVLAAASQLISRDWVHWFDAIDLVWQSGADGEAQPVLRLAWNCPADEVAVFEQEVHLVARQYVLQKVSSPAVGLLDGLPDLAVRLQPQAAAGLAQQMLSRPGLRIVQIASLGVLHVYGAGADSVAIGSDLQRQLEQSGGDWHSRHQPRRPGQGAEAQWRQILLEEFQRS